MRDFPIITADSIPVAPDSLSIPNDQLSEILADSLAKILPDSSFANNETSPKSDLETTINYNARDSIFFDLNNQSLFMYGETHIDYGIMTLEAERTDVDMDTKTINSFYTMDSTGRKIGKPVFTEKADVYETDNIVYNLDTKRAQIRGVITAQDGAYMHGDDVKKNEKDEMFIRGARYTTCDLSNPHFFIESSKLKVIPGNQVISGPFNLKFREVYTPLWFPFGMFPQPKSKASGIIFPTYGEETRRGFFLRGGGYYFAINDFIDLRITGDVYSKGGSGLEINSNYKKRYRFSGTMNFSYNRNISDEIENPLKTNDYWIRWNHRQDTRGSSNFSASVSLGSQSFNQNNNQVNRDFNRSIRSTYSSSISYSKRFQGTPFSMTLNARQNQNVQTGIATVTLPDFALTTQRQNPFKKLVKSSKSPLAKLNFSHNFVARNELTNKARTPFNFPVINENTDSQDTVEFKFENLDQILERSKSGGRHTLPISTSISLLKNFTLSPSFNYQEVWYTRELDFTYIEEEQAVRVDTIPGFSRAGSWSSGASLNTIIYGTYFFKGDGPVKAIRHVITPSVSFSYNPDFGDPSRGVYKDVQIDSLGNTRRVSKYEGFVYGSPSGSEAKSMSFNVQNNLELKVRDKKDTTGTGTKKIKLFDNFSFGSSYNFAAEQFKLSDIRFSTRTSFFKKAISINVSGTIDPYIYDLLSERVLPNGNKDIDQVQIDRFAWNSGQGLGQLSSLNTAISLNLRPKSRKPASDESEDRPSQNLFGDDPFNQDNNFGNTLDDQDFEELQYIQRNPDEYIDFNIPWSFRVSYSINRTKRGFEEANIRQTLTFGGNVSITPKTKISLNSGYDLEKKDFTSTRIGITRDLHCWGLTFNWVPFGRFQSFSLVIQPNSSLLQDLKLQRRRSFQDFFGG